MQELIALVLYAMTLLGMLYGALPEGEVVFAAGTGHEGLDCTACHHAHAPLGVWPEWQRPTAELPRFAFHQQTGQLLDESSLLCLSCHDGAVAVAVAIPPPASMASQVGRSVGITGERRFHMIGGHPLGVRYDPLDPKLAPEPGRRWGVEISLPQGRMQCVSCHDPHGTSGHEKMLVVSNRRSRLCLTCHQL